MARASFFSLSRRERVGGRGPGGAAFRGRRSGTRSLQRRGANADVGAAAAEVAAEALSDLVGRGMGIAVEEGLRGDDEPRRAEPALLRVVVPESLLHGMHPIGIA